MQTRPLGQSGTQVSLLGMGTWGIGGGWGPTDDEQSIRAIHAAIDHGITLIDTAAGYGDGHSERVIARALSGMSQRPMIATKTPPAPGPWPPSPYCRWQDRYPAAYLRDNIHRRMELLGVDKIDLLQLHTWTPAWNDDPQPLLVLRQLREEGKVDLIGVSTPEQDQGCVIQLMRDGLVDVVQIVFNIFEQESAAQILPVALETGTGVVVRVVLDEGSLGGNFNSETSFPEDDFRHQFFAGDRLQRTLTRVEAVQSLIDQAGLGEDYSLADVAIKFAAARPEVSSVLVGMRSPRRVQQNVAAIGKPDLPESLLEELKKHHWRRGVWYAGK
ncbi:MAG: aldo/keto reductase [Planctomycetota bacterium]